MYFWGIYLVTLTCHTLQVVYFTISTNGLVKLENFILEIVNDIFSIYGYSRNQIIVWKYSTISKVRIFNLFLMF